MTYADRIPLIRPADALRQARTAGIFAPDRPAPTDADRIEAERDDLRIQLGREQAETRNMVRDRDEVIRERDEARRACDDAHATADYWQGIVTTVCGERDEALGTISQAWAALNAAGLASPTASVAELIGQLTAERDEARRERDKLDAEATRWKTRLVDDLDRENRAHGETVKEYERVEQMADNLAAAIARLTGAQIGEHSSMNCPWENALQAATERAETVPTPRPPGSAPDRAQDEPAEERTEYGVRLILADGTTETLDRVDLALAELTVARHARARADNPGWRCVSAEVIQRTLTPSAWSVRTGPVDPACEQHSLGPESTCTTTCPANPANTPVEG
ncbi:hypothetical protein OOK41_31730 [Micromonospora sp. NBC_01655]|uniref:hypothetical protein n=1 Tax=Micromonospora sp. NBC_01655 TaxID=2975983 RepID=UPI0022506A1D|nr:hypothetical protein [Micromonospora sp. NBC_01655]MCX4474833.1 hypothetical protein [Micromonospora sp. NBC_01655]